MSQPEEEAKEAKAEAPPAGGAPPAYGYGFPFPQPFGPPMMMPPYAYPPGMMPVAPAEKKTEGGLCTVHPPGCPRPFEVPFPERKLPVCLRCKKNYRSRELCRSRDEHRALPWQTAYVVVTLTDEILEKKPDGTLGFADIPVVAELQDTPEMCRGPADGSMREEPICKVCKEKNYTTDHCRNSLNHTTPPYQSVYVKLVPRTDGLETSPPPPKRKKKRQEEHVDGRPTPAEHGDGDTGEALSDDLTVIHESKTFFALISAHKIVVKWCEAIRYPETSDKPGAPQGFPAYLNNPQGGYANQAQMWDAFRAGAMWAQQSQVAGLQPGQMQLPLGAPVYPAREEDAVAIGALGTKAGDELQVHDI
ncbi:hypothetical protein ACHAXT_007382 [Thalassiosira profunda]